MAAAGGSGGDPPDHDPQHIAKMLEHAKSKGKVYVSMLDNTTKKLRPTLTPAKNTTVVIDDGVEEMAARNGEPFPPPPAGPPPMVWPFEDYEETGRISGMRAKVKNNRFSFQKPGIYNVQAEACSLRTLTRIPNA